MKLTLMVIGKTTNPHIAALIDDYTERLKHYVPFSFEVIPDLKNTKNLSFEEQKKKEGELVNQRLSPNDCLILLDEHGKEQRSIEFASYLQKLMERGQNLVFLIGGAYGFSSAIYERANLKISLSQMTFSHQMVRAIAAEQLYRAFTILKNEPYHHE